MENKKYHFGIDQSMRYVCLFIFVLTFLLILMCWDDVFERRLYMFVCAGGVFGMSRKLILDQKGIAVTFFGIPVRKIPWNQVKYVERIVRHHRQVTNHQDKRLYMMVFILAGCYSFLSTVEDEVGSTYFYKSLDNFCLSHPFKVITYNIPERKEQEYTEIVELFHPVTKDRA